MGCSTYDHKCIGPIRLRLQKCIGPIRERFENSSNEYKNIIDFSHVKKGDIYVNLIHYDKNLKNEENFEYYRYFSVNLIGCYCPFDDFDMLKLFLTKLRQIPFSPSYILMTSGSEAEKILKEFNDIEFIDDVIIFYLKIESYHQLKKSYNKIKVVTNEFDKIVKFLKTKHFPKNDLDMDNHLLLTPLLTYYDYKKALFPVNKILANFFQPKYNNRYFFIAKRFIRNSALESTVKKKILNIMEKLMYEDELNFPKNALNIIQVKIYAMSLIKLCEILKKNYVEMAHFIGPFYYGIYKYTLDNPNKQLKQKTILFRDVSMERLDLYSYQFCENDIICFPSFTSTTLDQNLNFIPSNNANLINNDHIEEKSFVKMIITYDPKGKCVPQCVDISDESQVSNEKEILFFPFSFFKITKIDIHTGKQNDKHIIYLNVINKGDTIEYGLLKNHGFKLIENGTKLVIDKESDLSNDKNELFYNFKFKYIEDGL